MSAFPLPFPLSPRIILFPRAINVAGDMQCMCREPRDVHEGIVDTFLGDSVCCTCCGGYLSAREAHLHGFGRNSQTLWFYIKYVCGVDPGCGLPGMQRYYD